MHAMTGFLAPSCLISRHMRSLASASPPGESTRSTTAAVDLSLASARSFGMMASGVMVLEPADEEAPGGQWGVGGGGGGG